MKFALPFEGDYDAEKKQFTISGKTVAGNKSSVTIPVTSPQEFLVWVAQCLGEPSTREGGPGTLVQANGLALSMHQVSDDLDVLLVRLAVESFPVSFSLPVRNMTPERRQSIGEAMQVALALIEQAESGSPSN
ncbi:hypothetical protein [Shinella zoogloeoides]|uniref:hypothetical protein n=1 Tax=Shinella zoogloeoides TaxID=352475 RepID=UPI00273F9A95|nr:hypothetical protein [Shinella zoogloeoides]WLR94249.1 hypothetical protein Q9316_08800 [Shinella zoogloeoides]